MTTLLRPSNAMTYSCSDSPSFDVSAQVPGYDIAGRRKADFPG